MKRTNKIYIGLILIFLSFFSFFTTALASMDTVAQWARSLVKGSSQYAILSFKTITVDTGGNIYIVGSIQGTGVYNLGNGVTVSGTSDGYNAVLIKYDINENVQWVKTITSGSVNSEFSSVAVDSSGNIYVVGYIYGNGTYDFGNGVSVTGASPSGTFSGYNPVLVKYDSSGNAQWAKSTISGPGNSEFNSIAVDSSGNIYAGGYISKTYTYDFGNNISVTGICYDNNSVLVKYNSSGDTQWAKSVTSGSSTSIFNSVAADSNGNIYAGGYVSGTSTYNFGNGVNITGTSSHANSVLVRYDSGGNVVWAKK